MRIHEGLLTDATYAFDSAYIERVLAAKIAWMRAFDLSANFVILLFALQSLHLCFGQDDAFLCRFFLQNRQALLEIRKTMPQPDGADARGRNKDAPLAQFVAGSCLPKSRER